MYGRKVSHVLQQQLMTPKAFKRLKLPLSCGHPLCCIVAAMAGIAILMYAVLLMMVAKVPSSSPLHLRSIGSMVQSVVGSSTNGIAQLVVFQGMVGDFPSPCFTDHFVDPDGKEQMLVSLVVAVRDRTELLERAMITWLDCSELGEVVLVDWGSDPPLSETLSPILQKMLKDSRVRLIRADGESTWSIVRAYNLGLQFASGSLILKVDADTLLQSTFFERHLFVQGINNFFYRGNWRQSPDENNKHLNGIVYIHKQHLMSVMGYDERMENYGHDDSDLYQRLCSLGLDERPLDYSTLNHIPHSESERKSNYKNLKWLDHSRNIRGANETFSPWHMSGMHPSTYNLSWEVQNGLHICKSFPVYKPPGFLESLGPSAREPFDLLAHHWALRIYCQKKIPWEVITKMKHKPSIRALMAVYRDVLEHTWKGSYLILHVRHGVAERLRAYCSAKAYAWKSGVQLVTIWAPDEFSQTRFSDLFEVDEDSMIIEEWNDSFFSTKGGHFKKISYVKNNFKEKGALIKVGRGKAVYVESAHMLATDPVIDSEKIPKCYQNLKPSQQVAHILAEWMPQMTSFEIGLHLPLYPGYPRYLQQGHLKPTLESNEVQCNLKEFAQSMDKMLEKRVMQSAQIFMSCDTFNVCVHAQKMIKAPTEWIYEERKTCEGSGVTTVFCEQVFLADAFLLSNVQMVFAPENSAFLDLTQKLSKNETVILSPCNNGQVLSKAGVKSYSSSKCTTTVCIFLSDMMDELRSVL